MKDRIIEAIQNTIPCQHLVVELQGNHCSLEVVSEAFTGLNPVKRQQKVYACIGDLIASGELHAVNIKAYTPDTWAGRES